MIDLESETPITLPEACKLPAMRNRKTGQPCAVSQLYRYAMGGARAVDGTRVKLEVVKLPSGLCTTREAVARLIARLTNPDADLPEPTTKARQREISRAESDLEAAGFEIGGV